MAIDLDALDDFTRSYVEAALWSSTDHADDSGGAPLDDNYGPEDIGEETLVAMVKDCDDFREANAEDLKASGLSDERAGRDFWLTRNGHGAGFWDEGLGDVGDRLTDAAHVYGSVNLYVGDDGKVHGT